MGYDVEERLQREALDVEVQLSLPQLDPLGENLVVGFYLVGQFAHIVLVALAADGIDHAVDEW